MQKEILIVSVGKTLPSLADTTPQLSSFSAEDALLTKLMGETASMSFCHVAMYSHNERSLHFPLGGKFECRVQWKSALH